jgi:hypothetical protein
LVTAGGFITPADDKTKPSRTTSRLWLSGGK